MLDALFSAVVLAYVGGIFIIGFTWPLWVAIWVLV